MGVDPPTGAQIECPEGLWRVPGGPGRVVGINISKLCILYPPPPAQMLDFHRLAYSDQHSSDEYSSAKLTGGSDWCTSEGVHRDSNRWWKVIIIDIKLIPDKTI